MADRAVSFDVLAIDKASKALAEVGREVEQLARRIDSADGDIRVDADTNAAREKIAQVDSQLARLNAKSFRIDAETAKAQRDLQVLEAELKKTTDTDRKVRIDGDISAIQAKLRQLAAEKVAVDVETAAAQAKIRRLQDDLRPKDPKPIQVDADVAGALANLGRVAAAAAAIPAVITIAVGAVGALAGASAALGLGLGAGIAGTRGLGDAVQALGEKSTAAGGAATVSASAIRSANQAVVDARRDLVRANEAVGDAEKDLARAQEDAQRAQEALTDARKAASRELEDYQLRAAGMALSEESAALSVAESQERLRKVNEDAESTATERARAELNVREALQRQNELAVEAKRLTEDKTAADAKGVEGSDQVVAAQDRIRAANDGVVQAQRNLQKAHEDVTRATERVAEAITRLHEAAAPKGGGGGGGVDKLAEAMDELGPKAQRFAKYLYDLKEGPLKDLRVAGQEAFLPGVQSGLERMERQLPGITPAWVAFSREVGTATGNVIAMGAELAGPFLNYATASMQGLSGLQDVLQGLTDDLGATFDRMAATGEAEAAMRAVVDVVGAVVAELPALIEGGAQVMTALGPGLTAVIRELMQGLTDSMPTWISVAEEISALLTAIAPIAPELAVAGAAFALFKKTGGDLGTIFGAAKGGFDLFRTAITGSGDAADSARSRIAGVASFVTGPWGLAIAGATVILGSWAQQHIEAAKRVNELTSAIERDSGAIGANTRERVVNALESEGALSAAKALGISLKDVTDATLGNADAMARVNALLNDGRIWDSGDIGEYAANIKTVQDAIGGESSAVREAVEVTRRKAEADGQATDAAGRHSAALDGTARSADGTNQSLQRLNQTQQEAAAQFATTEQADLRVEQSLTRLSEAVRENGRHWDDHTTKAQANRQAILDSIGTANDNIAVMERSGAPISAVTSTFAAQREELIRNATQMMGNRQRAQEYIDRLLQVPKSVSTDVKANTGPAMAALQALQDKLRAVNGVLTVTPTTGSYGQGLGVYKSSGGWVGRATNRGMPFAGGPRGRDTVPGWLDPAEFVIRSEAAAQWGPLLELINAGATPADVASAAGTPAMPAQRAAGGTGAVINISVQVSGVVGDEDAVIRRIGSGLQQGIERGVIPRDLFAART